MKKLEEEMVEADDTCEKTKISDRRHQANLEKVLAKLQAAAASSVATLYASLFDGSPSTRIRAASAILNLAITFTDIRDLEKRLSTLERRK
jgi:hypothetical protein